MVECSIGQKTHAMQTRGQNGICTYVTAEDQSAIPHRELAHCTCNTVWCATQD